MNHYRISENDISLIRTNLIHIKRNCTNTPDTESEFTRIREILNGLEAVP